LSILVVGTVAFDSVETPLGKAADILGGSATYFSAAASLYTDVRLVAVVGRDFPDERLDFLRGRGVDTQGLEVADGRTFRWSGRYDYKANTTETLETQLNVLGDFHPKLPAAYANSDIVFLANIVPDLQREVLAQVPDAKLTMMDTMDLWINTMRESLIETIKLVDIVTMNESEARALVGTGSILSAARWILELGPKMVVIKRGEYGCVKVDGDGYFTCPARLQEEVKDPTGAGDSFAGGFLGYLDKAGDHSESSVRKAVINGSAVASFTVEEFGVERLRQLTPADVARRYREFQEFSHLADW
jgi:sugar/nucleoside kinase (ribokinase family)